jgi:hypothetical protein
MTNVAAQCEREIKRSPYRSQIRTEVEKPVGVATMESERQKAEETASRYIGEGSVLEALGAGAEGYVFSTPQYTAVKVFARPPKFERELAVYERLATHGVTHVEGFNVPKLVGYSRDLLVIEMTIVQPPYLLDFAQSELDFPLDFPEGHEEEWWQRLAELFGDRLSAVRNLYETLIERYGIYYYDLAPRNVNFGEW